MRKSLRTAAAVLILSALLAAPSHACSQEEAMQKVVELMQAIHELSQNDPEKLEKIRQELDLEMQRLEARNADDDPQAMCTFADKALRRIKE